MESPDELIKVEVDKEACRSGSPMTVRRTGQIYGATALALIDMEGEFTDEPDSLDFDQVGESDDDSGIHRLEMEGTVEALQER